MGLAGNDGRVLANVQTAPGEIATAHSEGKKLPLLMLGALGVVFGDIGTSPIYAFREALHASTGGAPVVRDDVLGVLSLIVWALTLIVTVKYVVFVLRADNRGEGGTLVADGARQVELPGSVQRLILGIGICGAALFFGDAIITPAISVLSAVEGLEVVTPGLDAYVVPITLVILAMLFSVQRLGTGRVAAVFGPITALWFLAIAAAGAAHIADDLSVLYALNPYYAITYLASEFRAGLHDDRCGVPGGDRRGSALCRPRPFRAQADRARLAGHRVSEPAAQLFRARRVRARPWRPSR